MSELVFEWFAMYGLAAAFVVLVAAAIGAPLPATLLLLALGAFVAQGEVVLWHLLLVAASAAILGDNIGYVVGRVGGRRALDAIAQRAGEVDMLRRAEAFAARWGALSIFLTRWLFGGLGPWVNLTSGVATYSWPRFLFWDVLGEVVWVGVYVALGYVFSDRVQDLADLIVNAGWLLLAVVIAAASGWELARHARRGRDEVHAT